MSAAPEAVDRPVPEPILAAARILAAAYAQLDAERASGGDPRC